MRKMACIVIYPLIFLSVRYEGRLEGGDPFDTADDREQKEQSLIIGEGNTIEGLDIGV